MVCFRRSIIIIFSGVFLFSCTTQPSIYVRPGLQAPPEIPEENIRIEFAAVGDFGTGDIRAKAVASRIAASMIKRDIPRFILFLGDNFYEHGIGGPADAEKSFQRAIDFPGYGRLMSRHRIPIYIIPGNHDHRGSVQTQREFGRQRYGDLWRHPIDSLDLFLPKLVRFPEENPAIDMVLVDSEVMIDHPSPRMFHRHISVLDSLLSLSSAPWRIVAAHHPIRSVGRHANWPAFFAMFSRQELKNKHYKRYAVAIDSVLVRRGVHFFLSGHDHSLQVFRSPGKPVHIISGAGGKSSPVSPLPPAGDLYYANQIYGFFRLTVADSSITYAAIDTRGKVTFSDRIIR